MRVAGVHAALLRIPPYIASTQLFDTFRPAYPGRHEMAQLNAERATRKFRESLGLRQTPTFTPDFGILRMQAVLKLENSGVRRPEKPEVIPGIRKPPYESELEAINLQREEIAKRSKLWDRLFRKQLISQMAEKQGKLLWAEQNQIIARSQHEWKLAVQKYEETVDQETAFQIAEEERLEHERIELEHTMHREIQKQIQELEATQAPILNRLNDAWGRFTNLDPVLNLIVLSAALSDNDGTAAPVGIDGSDLLILMTMPSPSDVIWPETFTGPNPTSVKRTPKIEQNEEYVSYLQCHSIAAARESFATQPRFTRVRVIALSEGDSSLQDREILSCLTLDRRGSTLFEQSETARQRSLINFADRWSVAIDSDDENAIMRLLDEWDQDAGETYEAAIREWRLQLASVGQGFEDFTKMRRSFGKAIGNLVDFDFQGAQSFQVNLGASEIAELDVSADEMKSPEFWILAVELAELWEAESFSMDRLRKKSEATARVLNPNSLGHSS